MTMVFFVSQVLNNASTFLALWFYSAFIPYKEKYQSKKLAVNLVMFGGLLAVGLLRGNPPCFDPVSFIALTVSYFVFQFAVLVVAFQAPLWQKVLVFFAHKVIEAALIALIDKVPVLFPEILPLYMNYEFFNDYYSILLYGAALILNFVVCYIILAVYRALKRSKKKFSELMLFILIPVSQVCLAVEALYVLSRYELLLRVEGVFVLFACIIAVIGDISLFVTLDNIRKQAALEKQIELIEAQQSNSMKQLKNIAAVTKRQQMINHDLKNLFITAGLLLENNDVERAKKSIEDISEMLLEYESVTLCEHPVINAVANYKLIAAREADISLSFDFQIPRELPFSDIDICSVYTNILDNAISALSTYPQADKRSASLVSSVSHGFLLIRETNPYDENLSRQHTDEDALIHGFGMDIMQYITKKYDGWMEVTKEGGIFDLKISLPLA